MAMFEICYTDPTTGKEVTVEREFQDSHVPHFIPAKDWADDCAYGLADKGPYKIKEL